MTATILSETPLPLPSASGVEIVGSTAYVIADDAPFLYALDAATLALSAQIPLFDTPDFSTGRLPKLLKPDLEALTVCAWPGRGLGLLLLGSGSAPQRRVGYWVALPGTGSGPAAVAAAATVAAQVLDLQGLYAAAEAAAPAGTRLNIEAAAASDTELLLWQRDVGADAGAGGALLRFDLAAALAHLAGGGPAPVPQVQRYPLPEIAGCPAGFSGAAVAPDGRLWVTASVENTADPVLDGEVLGSFVGVLDGATGAARFARLAWADGRPYAGKVEGLALAGAAEASGAQALLLVTDDDRGGSTALRAVVR